MRHIWIAIVILALGAVLGGLNEDNHRHEKEMKQLEIKRLELLIKLKEK